MNTKTAARIFAAIMGGVILFQLLLAAGVPWGAVAWGGAFPGELPAHMKLASIGSAFLLAFFAFVVLIRAGFILPRMQSASRKLVWFVVAYSFLGIIANSITPSFWERIIWVPVTSIAFVAGLVVARSKEQQEG